MLNTLGLLSLLGRMPTVNGIWAPTTPGSIFGTGVNPRVAMPSPRAPAPSPRNSAPSYPKQKVSKAQPQAAYNPYGMIPELTTWADGGIAGLNGPELGLVGERGPEAIVPLDSQQGGGMGGILPLLLMLIKMIMSQQGVAQQPAQQAPQGGANSLLSLLGA